LENDEYRTRNFELRTGYQDFLIQNSFFQNRLSTQLRKNLFSPWKPCHNSPNPSFRKARSDCPESRKKAATGSRLAPATGGLGRDDDCLLFGAKQEQGEIFCNGQLTTDD
jgi:hypothetical protein